MINVILVEMDGGLELAQERKGTVLAGDDDERSRVVIARLIARLGLVTRSFGSGAELLAAARREAPMLVVLDSGLVAPSGYEVCCELRDKFGESLPIVFVSATRTDPNDEIAALLLGADDYFAKPLIPERFVARIRRLLARSDAPPARSALTPRELEVLRLLVDGNRPAEIAERLFITRKTASTHIEHILTKLGAHSQAQAVSYAVRDNILGSEVLTAR